MSTVDATTDQDQTQAVVYSIVHEQSELVDVLDSSQYTMHVTFDTSAEAQTLADQLDGYSVVRITIDLEPQP